MPIVVTGRDSSMKEKPEQRFSGECFVAWKGCSTILTLVWKQIQQGGPVRKPVSTNDPKGCLASIRIITSYRIEPSVSIAQF